MKQLVCVLVLLLGMISCKDDFMSSTTENEPIFRIKGYNVSEFNSNRMNGKKTFLFFFNPYCQYCRKEFPKIEELWTMLKSKNRKEIEFLAVTRDSSGLDELTFTMPVFLDKEAAVAKIYKAEGIPSFFIIGVDGKIEWSHTGTLTIPVEEMVDRMQIKEK